MIDLGIDARQLKRLEAAVGKAKKSFTKELAGAINAVSEKTKVKIGKDIRSVVAMKAAEAKKPISIKSKATAGNLSATVSLKETKRLGCDILAHGKTNGGCRTRSGRAAAGVELMGRFRAQRRIFGR